MVLSSGYGQRQLHQCGRQAVLHEKTKASTSKSQKHTTKTHIPAYRAAATAKINPKIPNPSIFDFESKRSVNDSTGLPTVAECATHLKLLQAFHYIYLKVSSSVTLDAVLGISPEPRTVFRRQYMGYRRGYVREAVKLRDDTFVERRKAKWRLYLSFAAARFIAWAEAVEKERNGSMTSKAGLLHLPPIDVLMVWHALLLNPSWFRSFQAPRLKNLYATPFLWEAIHKTIDANKTHFPYNLPTEDIVWFVENTGLAPDLFEYLVTSDKSIQVQQLLKTHGAPGRPRNAPRGIVGVAVTRVLVRANLDEPENKFLECCREAVSENLTITNLVAAVQRQACFVTKMEKYLWIRSPALEGTLFRAIERYIKFLKLFRLYPKTMLVPTLDIDLVWHTHQCSPSQYDTDMMKVAGRLVDHDDKLGEGILNPGFTKTRDLYRIRFGREYQVCNCWDCEALLSAVMSHSSETQPDYEAIARRVHTNVAYHRAVEIARRNGNILPLMS